MSTRYFCDRCERETDSRHRFYLVTQGEIAILGRTAMDVVNGVHSGKPPVFRDFCNACLAVVMTVFTRKSRELEK